MDESHGYQEHGDTLDWTELVRIACVAIAAAAVWFRLWEPFGRVSVVGLIGTVGGGWPIFHEAWVETVTIARRARGIIRFNFAGTLVVDAVGVGLAAVGLLNLSHGNHARATSAPLDSHLVRGASPADW
jgi:hypothetical protein